MLDNKTLTFFKIKNRMSEKKNKMSITSNYNSIQSNYNINPIKMKCYFVAVDRIKRILIVSWYFRLNDAFPCSICGSITKKNQTKQNQVHIYLQKQKNKIRK